ncbi:MAG TPA: tetratricopeptide repeat protein [Armatimonadota bacterium]|nr:tetratricopeptide repeat protein [Armatimonadota bacterium]
MALVVMCALRGLGPGPAIAQGPGTATFMLFFSLRGDGMDQAEALTYSGAVMTALDKLTTKRLWHYDITSGSAMRAVEERRITARELREWDRMSLDDPNAPARALAIARALIYVDSCVFGKVSPGPDQTAKLHLHVVDVASSNQVQFDAVWGESTTGEDIGRQVLAALAQIREGNAAGAGGGGTGPTAVTEPQGAAQPAGPATPSGPAPTADPGASPPAGGGTTPPDSGTVTVDDGPQVAPGPGPASAAPAYAASPDPQAEALYLEALALAQQNEPQKALDTLARARRIDPTSAPIWIETGRAYRRIGEPQQAIAAYKTALQYDPKNVALARELAELEADPTEPSRALANVGREQLEAMVQADPSNPELLRALADVCEKQSDLPAALRWYSRLQELLVKDIEVQRKIALTYSRMKDLDSAKRELEQLLLWEPKDPAGNQELARILSVEGDHREAFRRFVKASASWREQQALESPTYYALMETAKTVLVAALDGAVEPLTMLRGALLGSADESQGSARRESLYRAVSAFRDDADSLTKMLSVVEPPPSASAMHDQYVAAAGLTAQALVNLLVALDENSKSALETALWTRDYALTSLEEAVRLHRQLVPPAPSTSR